MQQERIVINQYFEDFLHEHARDGFRPKEYLVAEASEADDVAAMPSSRANGGYLVAQD